ncbi:carnitinyl-CoA dehydratase [Mycobacterium sp. 852013-50091_SCH5140682]|uniref:enoyl-CoA hydratase-related protein n=1 Tax=Mycobacterium sp. 852013-50091_SCH5140682 TaxID=1834109 RepID=UPI0007EA3908|nr:enoyl-CoA hydratase-related protein [Mycobacterium sp. 852013-50091_SCH5140682]OBC15380.1 carnitinyl-CoA dehydratase [Mycobacterium sp. 852013-50091_SCH5140682]
MTAAEGVTIDIDGPILTVTLDRPKANAIDAATSRALHAAISRLDHDDDLRVAVLTAAGDRFFSAGWDLKAANDGESAHADHGAGGFAGITELFGRRKPIIAAVNGSAYGGGVEMMLGADLVVASNAATFSFPEARIGVLPDAGGVIRLAARLPRALALELLLTGRSFTAHEAHGWGLVNRVVPAEFVLESAMELARSLCEAAPLSVAATLEIVEAAQGLSDEDAFTVTRRDLEVAPLVPVSDDAIEGARAFAEKRAPQWRGR